MIDSLPFHLNKKCLRLDLEFIFLDDLFNYVPNLRLNKEQLKKFPQYVRVTISSLFLNDFISPRWFLHFLLFFCFLFVFSQWSLCSFFHDFQFLAFFRRRCKFGIAFCLMCFFVLKNVWMLIFSVLNQYEVGRNFCLILIWLIIEKRLLKIQMVKHKRFEVRMVRIVHFKDFFRDGFVFFIIILKA